MNRSAESTDQLIRAMLEMRASRSALPGLLTDVMFEVEGTGTKQHARGLSMIRPIRFVTAAAAVLIVALGLTLAVRLPNGPGFEPAPTLRPTPTPVASPTPSPSAAPTVRPMVGVGLEGPVMDGGTYETVFFDPGFQFTVPDGEWISGQDIPRQWYLRHPAESVDALTIVRIDNVFIDPCIRGTDGGTKPWTGDAAGFFEWLNENAPVPYETPVETTALGQPALEIEFVQPEFPDCTGGYMPVTDVGRAFAVSMPGWSTRYTALDIDGRTFLVVTWASDPARWDEVRDAADEVLATVKF